MKIDYKLLGKNAGMVAKQIIIKGTASVAFGALVNTAEHTLGPKRESGTTVKEAFKNMKLEDLVK